MTCVLCDFRTGAEACYSSASLGNPIRGSAVLGRGRLEGRAGGWSRLGGFVRLSRKVAARVRSGNAVTCAQLLLGPGEPYGSRSRPGDSRRNARGLGYDYHPLQLLLRGPRNGRRCLEGGRHRGTVFGFGFGFGFGFVGLGFGSGVGRAWIT